MSRHIIIDSSGHTTFEFDGTNTTDLAEAERRFKKLMAEGYIPAENRGDGKHRVTDDPRESLIHILKRRFLFLP